MGQGKGPVHGAVAWVGQVLCQIPTKSFCCLARFHGWGGHGRLARPGQVFFMQLWKERQHLVAIARMEFLLLVARILVPFFFLMFA